MTINTSMKSTSKSKTSPENQQFSLFDKNYSNTTASLAISNYPKIDLHRHLLGSISSDMLLDIAEEHNLPLPTTNPEELNSLLTIHRPVNGLKPFFRSWPILSKLISNPDIISLLVTNVLKEAREDNIIYLELRASWGMTGKESYSVKTFLEGIQQGLSLGQEKYGVIGRVVLGITRHLFSRHVPWKRKELLFNIIEAATQFKDSVVVGFDLSGIEEGYPASLFQNEFQEIRRIGFPVTIHCGETTSVDNVWETIETLQPSRISHALSAINDKRLLKRLSELQIPIEICPTTNWLTQTVPDLSMHPIKKMKSNGTKLIVATDNPAICRTTLSKEYSLLMSEMGFSNHEIEQLIENSLDSMFGNHSLRQIVKEKYVCLKKRRF